MIVTPLNIVVLAAGQGKRMHSDLPKVLHQIAGKPLLGHVLDTARILNPARLCVVHGYGGEQVRQSFPETDLIWVRQELQLGTGHAVLQALPYLIPDGITLILSGDVPLIRPATLQCLLDAASMDCLALLTVELDNPHGYGRIVRTEGLVRRIVEEKDADDSERAIREINTGILIAPTDKLQQWLPGLGNSNAQGEYYLTDIISLAVNEGMQIHTVHPCEAWEVQGINSKAQLADLERVQQRLHADQLLEAGVTLADPLRLDVRGELKCGRDVRIDIGCVFEGKVSLADGVAIEAYSVLRNAIIGTGTRILPFSVIDGAKVGPGCIVGPYARLRPGATLGNQVHIGNFVEVKNSDIDDQSKANHLAYIGDATVGQRVNIGAGTITCNYDGANKHRTVIEDDAFIGSDSQLVAPVTVGRGATLGAGTTLTADAPADQLTVSRARQTSYSNWKRPDKKPHK
jgi:bifunctional UDP-N-acetylglucosamine pyrophosphorylase/glucosamine-1-phosphate N-acetyltransferase